MTLWTRRQLLALGLAGAGSAAAGATGLWLTADDSNTASIDGVSADDLVQPQELRSHDGVLAISLTAATARARIGTRQAVVHTYNGTLPGPTLRVRSGDTVKVAMTNSLDTPTNMHVHGLHVSPEANGDNPFVSIEPGQSFSYEFVLPDDHPPGTYWYHPHRHGHVADQLASGLYGAIIVEDEVPIPATRERTLVVSDISLDDSGRPAAASHPERMMGREGDTVMVNGQVRPRVVASPGERERWRIVNACPSRFLRLSLDGQDIRLLGRDVGRLTRPLDISEVVLAPGNRVELLVDTREGNSTLVAAPVDRGAMPGMMRAPRQRDTVSDHSLELLSLEVGGAPVAELGPVPAGPAGRDLRLEPVATRRTVEFAMGMGGIGRTRDGMRGNGSMMSFTIDGKVFDPDRTDISVRAGTVEEWTLVNNSPMDHPMHLHVWPLQVLDGPDDEPPTWQDVVNIPAFGQVAVRVAFDDVVGRTVYHCHVLDHEDLGMMGTIQSRSAPDA